MTLEALNPSFIQRRLQSCHASITHQSCHPWSLKHTRYRSTPPPSIKSKTWALYLTQLFRVSKCHPVTRWPTQCYTYHLLPPHPPSGPSFNPHHPISKPPILRAMGPAALNREPTLKYTSWEWMCFSVAYGEHFLIALHHTTTAKAIKCPFFKKSMPIFF